MYVLLWVYWLHTLELIADLRLFSIMIVVITCFLFTLLFDCFVWVDRLNGHFTLGRSWAALFALVACGFDYRFLALLVCGFDSLCILFWCV